MGHDDVGSYGVRIPLPLFGRIGIVRSHHTTSSYRVLEDTVLWNSGYGYFCIFGYGNFS